MRSTMNWGLMTEGLRTRIKEEVLDGILSMFSESDPVEMAAGYIADAVIRELGLKLETGIEQRHSMPPLEATRYVTEWETDD